MAKTAFTSMMEILRGRNINMAVRLRELNCYVEPSDNEKLEAADHWFLRIIWRIPWIDKFSICEVFRGAGVIIDHFLDM